MENKVMGSNLSVLIISKEYPPHVTGGLGVHYYELANELKKYCTVTVLCAKEQRDAKKEEHDGNLHIYRISSPKIFPLNHIYFNIAAFFKSLRIKKDIIHLCAPFGVFNALVKTVPTVSKIHAVYAIQKGNFLYNRIFFPLATMIDRVIIKRSDCVMTTSLFMKNDIVKNYHTDEAKITVIYNGINTRFFNENRYGTHTIKEQLGITDDKKIILYVGRFVKRKGALNLVKAATTVLEKFPNAVFLLIGGAFDEGSEYEAQIREHIKHSNLEKQVILLSWVSHDEIINYYNSADIFVHPALNEPFGNNIVEAMANGLPVISIDSGGPKEIIGANGILLANNEPDAIAAGISELLSNEQKLHTYGELSKKRAKDFSWDTVAQKTIDVYQNVIHNRT
jgi:glycosyltransferase involved in cell wall biosynthesis